MQKDAKFVVQAVKETVAGFFNKAFGFQPNVLIQNGPKGECEYVSPSAMKEFNMRKNKKEGHSCGCKTVAEFAAKVAEHFHENEYIGSIRANEKGFLQIKVKDAFVEEKVNELVADLAYPEPRKTRVVVDFSSPNIAKEMHVGHLRSTIIGESLCRILDFLGCDVKRCNHLGDWGTQFGMLIAYMQETYPDYAVNQPEIKDLDAYYKAARQRFDSDADFKKKSQLTVVKLQAYDEECYNAWKMICKVSRDYFNIIYKRLDISVEEYGESFYNPYIPDMLKELDAKGMIKEDDTKTKKGKKEEKKEEEEKKKQEEGKEEGGPKAKCIFVDKFPIPLMVVKSDGGYGYDSTDMACIQFRLGKLAGERLIYITDLGQREHFEMVFAAARKVGWLTNQKAEHMGFGVILGEDGKKFKTRGGKTVRLVDLLDEARDKALAQLKSREKQKEEGEEGEKEQVYTALKPEEYEDAAEKLGTASIKYYDLKQNRTSDYIFSFEKMLDPRGNTAVYLIYAYVRMCSIIRKSGLTSEEIHQLAKEKPFRITHPEERNLAAMLVKFHDVLTDAADDLAVNKVTDYVYDICVKVQENYKKYRIVGDEHMHSRIILCEVIRKVLEKAFFFMGIKPIDKI